MKQFKDKLKNGYWSGNHRTVWSQKPNSFSRRPQMLPLTLSSRNIFHRQYFETAAPRPCNLLFLKRFSTDRVLCVIKIISMFENLILASICGYVSDVIFLGKMTLKHIKGQFGDNGLCSKPRVLVESLKIMFKFNKQFNVKWGFIYELYAIQGQLVHTE